MGTCVTRGQASSWVHHLHNRFSVHLTNLCRPPPCSSDHPSHTPTSSAPTRLPPQRAGAEPTQRMTERGEHRPSLREWCVTLWLGTAGRPGCLSHPLCGTCTRAVGSPSPEPEVSHSLLSCHFPCRKDETLRMQTVNNTSVSFCSRAWPILLQGSKASARDFLHEAPGKHKAPKVPTHLPQR